MKKNYFFNGLKMVKKSISCKKNRCHYQEIMAYFLITTVFSKTFSFTYKSLKWLWIKISHHCKICQNLRLIGQHTFPNTTFLLCVRPKNTSFTFKALFFKRTQPIAKCFPPPGYGIPPGYEDCIKEYNYKPNKEYGLYLFPGRINAAFYFLTLLLSGLLFTPFLYESGSSYTVLIVTYCLLGYIIYKFLFTRMMPVSLTQVWEKWPIPAYELFLSVPHSVYISWHDRLTYIKKTPCKNDECDKDVLPTNYQKPQKYIFWNPDTKTPMWRQSTESSPNMHTLQELILNLAVFEFLFHRNDHQSASQPSNETSQQKQFITPKVESIREYHWYFFLFSPILINLLLILLSIFFFSALKGEEAIQCSSLEPSSKIQEKMNKTCIEKNYQYSSQCYSLKSSYDGKIKAYNDCNEKGYQFSSGFRLLLHFPYNIVIAVLTWFLFTLFYVSWILATLTDLSKKIRHDYFNAHLDLIPQQILNQLSYIPTQQQIDSSIAYVKTILNWSSSIVFIGLMAVLEIFSQSASRMHIDYAIGEKTFSLLMKIKIFIIGG